MPLTGIAHISWPKHTRDVRSKQLATQERVAWQAYRIAVGCHQGRSHRGQIVVVCPGKLVPPSSQIRQHVLFFHDTHLHDGNCTGGESQTNSVDRIRFDRTHTIPRSQKIAGDLT